KKREDSIRIRVSGALRTSPSRYFPASLSHCGNAQLDASFFIRTVLARNAVTSSAAAQTCTAGAILPNRKTNSSLVRNRAVKGISSIVQTQDMRQGAEVWAARANSKPTDTQTRGRKDAASTAFWRQSPLRTT